MSQVANQAINPKSASTIIGKVVDKDGKLKLQSLQCYDDIDFVTQVWCEIATPKYYQILSAGDPHAPSIARYVMNMILCKL